MRARDVAGLLTLATLAGCATSPHEVHESPAAAPAPLDAPAQPQGEREAAPMPAADDELGLAEYERMLAANEERLRAAGVLVAQREQERAVGDARFAQPPPAAPTPGDALGGVSPTGGAASRAKRKDSSKDKTTTATAARPAAPKPTATPSKQAKPTEEARPEPKAEAAAADADEAARGGRCQQICDLADATCDLSGKICDLAARHPGEARYTGLCQRADDDCDLAAAACQRCSP